MVEISTKRLDMRPPHIRDLDAIHTVLSNFEISKYLSRVAHPFPKEDAAGWIERNSSAAVPADTAFALFDKTGGFCGMASFDLDEKTGTPEIGYYLDTPFWGLGLMSEAVSAALAWLFSKSDVQLVNSGAYTFNPASLAIQYKLGFKDVREGLRICEAQGEELPIVVTQLQRENFKPLEGRHDA